jgi:hypothetical protein
MRRAAWHGADGSLAAGDVRKEIRSVKRIRETEAVAGDAGIREEIRCHKFKLAFITSAQMACAFAYGDGMSQLPI